MCKYCRECGYETDEIVEVRMTEKRFKKVCNDCVFEIGGMQCQYCCEYFHEKHLGKVDDWGYMCKWCKQHEE